MVSIINLSSAGPIDITDVKLGNDMPADVLAPNRLSYQQALCWLLFKFI